MWRVAKPEDDDRILAMCMELNREDPGDEPVPEWHVRRTLTRLRSEPHRGSCVVLELAREVAGYALLIPFWSNEMGGDLCEVDELFVMPEHRSRGYGRALFANLECRAFGPPEAVGIALIVRSGNPRARKFYASLGFERVGSTMVRRARGDRTSPMVP